MSNLTIPAAVDRTERSGSRACPAAGGLSRRRGGGLSLFPTDEATKLIVGLVTLLAVIGWARSLAMLSAFCKSPARRPRTTHQDHRRYQRRRLAGEEAIRESSMPMRLSGVFGAHEPAICAPSSACLGHTTYRRPSIALPKRREGKRGAEEIRLSRRSTAMASSAGIEFGCGRSSGREETGDAVDVADITRT